MLRIKSIEKDGKYLKIIIKKPYFISLQKFMVKHNLLFSKYDKNEEMYNFNWCITEDNDIQLDFILRNYDDIKPYIKPIKQTKEMKKISDEIAKNMEKVNVYLENKIYKNRGE